MKIVLITGGSRGLGKNSAIHAAQRGMGVIITYKSQEADAMNVVREIETAGGQAIALQLDTSKIEGFGEFTSKVAQVLQQKWGASKIDGLVNNAGTGFHTLIENTTEEQFDEMLNVHLKGPFFLTQRLIPLIAEGGHIINISSGLARFSFPGSSVYAMMKGGVEVMTRYLSKELGPKGIRVNTVAPGAIETDFNGARVRNSPEVKKQLAAVTNLGRVGVPEDIGPLIASLLSDDSRWVNAQRIEVSGGTLS